MPKSSFPPAKLGKLRIRLAALRYGASLDDQTIESITDVWNRQRATAFVDYDRKRIATWYKFTLIYFGSPTGKPEDLPPAARERARTFILDDDVKDDAAFRKELQFPALVRSQGFDNELLNVFGPPTDSAVEVGSRLDDLPPAALSPEWSAATVHDRFTSMIEPRLQLLCLGHGSPDESVEGVPAQNRVAFDEHIEWHNQARQALFENACAEHGSKSGFFEDIEPAAQPAALFDLGDRIARFADGCKYELALLRISKREESGSELIAEFG